VAGVVEEQSSTRKKPTWCLRRKVSEHGQYAGTGRRGRRAGLAANGGENGVLDENEGASVAPEELAGRFREQQQAPSWKRFRRKRNSKPMAASPTERPRTWKYARPPWRNSGRSGAQDLTGSAADAEATTRWPQFKRRDSGPVPLIFELLKPGQEVLIQIAKEPIAKTRARASPVHIALPGRFLVYMPHGQPTWACRAKIESAEERMRLKRIVVSERENGVGGFIVRTAAGRRSGR